MATRQITVHLVECDICDKAFERDDSRIHFGSADQGIADSVDAGWIRLDDGRLICTNSDFMHDMARIPEVAT